MSEGQSISEMTRREVLDLISGSWSGRLDDVEFLSRLYDLEVIRSTDPRHDTAAGDIWRHRIANDDWSDDWVFGDPRFNIRHAPDDEFMEFVAETVHPIVRPDADEAAALVGALNRQLTADGWHLLSRRELSGRPIYEAERLDARIAVVDEPTGWPRVDRQVQQARESLMQADSEEEFQAVGLVCREILISAAQAVYDRGKYPTLDGTVASETDANRMLTAVIAVELAGGANEEARAHAKAALKLALALQHDRAADFRAAALCAEATFSVVNIIAILVGRRDRI